MALILPNTYSYKLTNDVYSITYHDSDSKYSRLLTFYYDTELKIVSIKLINAGWHKATIYFPEDMITDLVLFLIDVTIFINMKGKGVYNNETFPCGGLINSIKFYYDDNILNIDIDDDIDYNYVTIDIDQVESLALFLNDAIVFIKTIYNGEKITSIKNTYDESD